MPWDHAQQKEFTCSYCEAADIRCLCDMQRTTGGCWAAEHGRCNGTVNSSSLGKVECLCRCHLPAVTDQEVAEAIASILGTR